MRVDVRLGAARLPAGVAHNAAIFQEDIRLAAEALDDLAAEGLFAYEREVQFAFELHYDSVEDWSTFVDRPKAGALEVDEELVAAALAASVHGGAAVIATETVAARLYDRLA